MAFRRHCKFKSENTFFLFLILRDFLPAPKGYHQAIKLLALRNKSCITFICPTIYIQPCGQITEQMQGLKPQSFYLICSNQAIYIVVLVVVYFWTCCVELLCCTGYWPACNKPKLQVVSTGRLKDWFSNFTSVHPLRYFLSWVPPSLT